MRGKGGGGCGGVGGERGLGCPRALFCEILPRSLCVLARLRSTVSGGRRAKRWWHEQALNGVVDPYGEGMKGLERHVRDARCCLARLFPCFPSVTLAWRSEMSLVECVRRCADSPKEMLWGWSLVGCRQCC
ncbi:hypothetical protein BaRGS_00035932 [Batillaria attramentaria]|uniref:Uncharacterized protein n=1 Tax=Batillaria attramentaria TaxID=370345 RepID=A0ABD0JDF3_9CAEN